MALAVLLAGCGDNDDTPSGASADSNTSNDPESGSSETGNGAQDDGAPQPDEGDGGGVAGLDLESLGAPPDAEPQTAVAVVDGETYVFAAAELGSARCEVGPDSIAVNIGQSEDWFTFVATRTGDTWTIGPSLGFEEGSQQEGLTPGARITVDGQTVLFEGEIVIKTEPTDFDSWKRTLGSVVVNCAPRGASESSESAATGGDLVVNGDRWPIRSTQLCEHPDLFDFIAWGEDSIRFFLEVDEASGEYDARLNGSDVEDNYGESTLYEDISGSFTLEGGTVVGTFELGHPDVASVKVEVNLTIPAPDPTCPAH